MEETEGYCVKCGEFSLLGDGLCQRCYDKASNSIRVSQIENVKGIHVNPKYHNSYKHRYYVAHREEILSKLTEERHRIS